MHKNKHIIEVVGKIHKN